MSKRPHKYQRCAKCKQLVNYPCHCANCANYNPLSLNRANYEQSGRRGANTLDFQEGNREEYFGG